MKERYGTIVAYCITTDTQKEKWQMLKLWGLGIQRKTFYYLNFYCRLRLPGNRFGYSQSFYLHPSVSQASKDTTTLSCC